MKKTLSIILSIVMLLSITAGLNLSVYADELTTGSCGENATYSFDSETGALTISGTGDMTDYDYGESPFYENTVIESVIINPGVTSIGDSAFSECSRLTSIAIPNSVIKIGNSSFENCTALKNLTIENGLKIIGNQAFSNCTSLTDIIIPDSVTSIGSWAFASCKSITNIMISDKVTELYSSSFSLCTNLSNITVDNNNKYFSSADGVLFNKDKTVLIKYPIGNDRTEYIIPDGVTKIFNSSFLSCNSLKSVTIPKSIIEIGPYVFDSCVNLTDVNYYGTKEDWLKINIYENSHLETCTINYLEKEPEPVPEPSAQPATEQNTETTTRPATGMSPIQQTTTVKAADKYELALKSVKVKRSAKKLILQATLKNNGKVVKGKKVTFNFNGKKYTAKTNAKGVAKVTIKKSVLSKLKKGKKVTYSVSYGKKSVKKTVKVK